jgi:actin-like ATPase involved in cell morphogenesis
VSGSGWSLAIDFGTSFTTGAMLTGDGAPVLVEVEHSRYLPSVVVANRDGQLLTGEAARRQAVVFPERAVRVPKRALVTRLVAAVLGRIYGEAVRFQGGTPPSSVVLTHPARWGEVPLGRLREAAAAATESDALVFVPEPVAAALWYGDSVSPGDLVAVFDLGGGTLDTAVLRAAADGFTIAGPPGGDANLGGEDFDELLLERVSEIARDRDELTWTEVFEGTDARARRDQAQLRSDVTVAKEAMSEVNAYEVVVPGFAEGFRLTRPELDELFGPLIERAVAELGATIAAAGAAPGALRGLYLTGGSSRMPLVAARLAAALGIEPQMRDDPKAAVVLGALTHSQAGVRTPAVPMPAAPSSPAMPGDGSDHPGSSLEAAAELADILRAAEDAGSAMARTHFQKLYAFGLEQAKLGHLVVAKPAFEHVRDRAKGPGSALYVAAAKSAISHLPGLQADLNDAWGKITIVRKPSFWSWTAAIDGQKTMVRIDQSDDVIVLGATGSATRDVPPGPHIIGTAASFLNDLNREWAIAYIAPGKEVRVEVVNRIDHVYFFVLS